MEGSRVWVKRLGRWRVEGGKVYVGQAFRKVEGGKVWVKYLRRWKVEGSRVLVKVNGGFGSNC